MDNQELLIGYALGILDHAEQQEVETQIARDPALREQIQVYQREIHVLALAAQPVTPPPALKQALLQRVAAQAPAASASRRMARWTPAAWVAGVAILLVFALGGWNISLRSNLARLRSENTRLTASLETERTNREALGEELQARDRAVRLLSARDMTQRALAGTATAPAATGTMYMEPGNVTAVLVVSGLEPLPKDLTYQLWLARDGVPIPSNTFNVDASGQAQVVIEASDEVNAFQEVMVTVEPAAGSSTPTDGRVVLAGTL